MWEKIYSSLKAHFPRFDVDQWWGIRDPFARMAGSVLVQNTTWRQAAKALAALEERQWLDPGRLSALTKEALMQVIRPAGFPRAKSETLIRLAAWVEEKGGMDRLLNSPVPTDMLRMELLAIKGIGPETADTILAYALGRAAISGDMYARRLVHRLTGREKGYEEIRREIMARIDDPDDLRRLHAMLVEHGKEVCRKRSPRCEVCLLADDCTHFRKRGEA